MQGCFVRGLLPKSFQSELQEYSRKCCHPSPWSSIARQSQQHLHRGLTCVRRHANRDPLAAPCLSVHHNAGQEKAMGHCAGPQQLSVFRCLSDLGTAGDSRVLMPSEKDHRNPSLGSEVKHADFRSGCNEGSGLGRGSQSHWSQIHPQDLGTTGVCREGTACHIPSSSSELH
jgi:hypothetical protein